MTQRRTWVEKAPVGLATTGSGGGAARRLKARLAKENWEVAPGFKFRPGFIYTQVRAISARINQNYDGWPADELEKSYRTFIGKPCFVNHQNENPKEARGVVVASRYVENGRDKYVDVIQEIDAQRYPKLAHEIITGGMDSVSMGAEAAFTICSYCKHKATDEHDMCNHVKFHKGEKLAKFNRRTGKTENVLVYESCHKLSFFELSYVFEPADETAVASRVLVASRKAAAVHPDWDETPWGWRHRPTDTEVMVAYDPDTGDEAGYDLSHEGEHLEFQQDPHAFVRDSPHDLLKTYNRSFEAAVLKAAGLKKTASWDSDALEQFQHHSDSCQGNALQSAEENWTSDPDMPPVNDERGNYTDEAWNGINQWAASYLKSGDSDCMCGHGMECDHDPRGFEAAVLKTAGFVKEAPFAGYDDFADCESENQDKGDTGAYCGEIKHRTEDKTAAPRKRKTYDPNTVYGNPDAEPCVHKLDAASQNLYDMAVSQGMSHEEAAAHADRNERAEASTYEDPCPGGCDDVRQASFEARVLQAVAMGNDCLPGQPCDKAPGLDLEKMPKGTASGAPAAVVTTDSSPAAAGGGGTPVSGEKGANGLLPGTQALNDLLLKQFPGSDIGGYRVDPAYPDEHPAGKALDFMSTNPEQWKQVRDLAFQNGADYVINDNKMWYPGGKTEPYTGPNPHTDHVHIHVPGQTTASFESKVLRMAGYKTTTFEDRVLRAAGMVRLAEEKKEKKKDENKEPERKTKGPDDPKPPLNPGMPPVPAGTQGTFTAPAAPDPAQHGQTQGAPPGPVGAGLENWQLPGGTNPTDPNGLAMPYAQSQVGQWSPTLNHTVTTEDVTGKANQGNIDAWNKANPTNVFDPDMKYDPASMERGVQHVFTKPGPEGAGAPPPPAAPVAPAVPPPPAPADAASQVGTNTPTVPPLPTPPPPPGPEALAPPPAPTPEIKASFERRVLRLAYGEVEAPTPVDTLREEGSAPEDANDDFHHYVAPPDGLRDPNLSQAGQFGGQGPQPEQGVGGMGANPEDNPAVDANYMVLKIPMPGTAPPGPMQPPPQPGGAMPPQISAPPQGQPPGIPMQNFASRSLLAGVDQYLGIDAGATTLGNGRGVSQTSRKPRKGQTMGRSRTSLSQRGKVASQGKRQHFAEGPYTDGGPYGRNDEGEQQDVFLTQPPPPEHVEAPDEDTHDISNTKGNLVARVQQGRAQLLRDAQALAAYQAREGSRRQAGEHDWGGPNAVKDPINPMTGQPEGLLAVRLQGEPGVPQHAAARRQGEALVGGGGVIDPSVQDSESEALTGDHFEALGEAPVRTDPKQAARQAENSLSAFQAFDRWLHSATGRQARHHTAKNIRLAADEWAKRANYDVKVLFPALGIVLRQARKIEAAQTKGAKMRKRADEKLDLAAPDARIDVEAPVANVTDAEAQESQFDTSDFANNAGDSLADPDLSTDSQFWAPGEGSKKSSSQQPRKATPAGGILAVRAAEAYINAGLERPESKYQLAGLFENMNKGVVQRDIALLERVAQLQSQTRQKVASGKTRGAAPSLPAGLSSGGMRVASVQRMAANDPSNDALLFD